VNRLVNHRFFALFAGALVACERSAPPSIDPSLSAGGEPRAAVVDAASDLDATGSTTAAPSNTDSNAVDASAARAVDASASRADVAPIEVPAAKPCEVQIEVANAQVAQGQCIDVPAIQPAGEVFTLCVGAPMVLRFRYDERGRVVEAGDTRYEWRPDGSARRTSGRTVTTLRFDPSGRVVAVGATRLSYDPLGRLRRSETQRRFLQYNYQPDGTYTTTHNYPDSDEFCVADRVEVRRDSLGRAVFERYDNCGINEIDRILHLEYGENNRLARVRVDLSSDGNVDATATLRYPTADGGCR
jgi:hypothetical protein